MSGATSASGSARHFLVTGQLTLRIESAVVQTGHRCLSCGAFRLHQPLAPFHGC